MGAGGYRLLAVVVTTAVVAALALAAPAGAATTVGFWAGEEFVGDTGFDSFEPRPEEYWLPRDTAVYTDRLWRALARRRTPLYMHLRYKRDFGPVPAGQPRRTEGLALVREAIRRRVPVHAWIVVPFSEGYWAFEGNAAAHQAAVRDFDSWARAKRLRFKGVSIDLEPSIQQTRKLYDAFGSNPGGMPDYLDETVNPARQCAAVMAYRDLITDAHRRGIFLSAAAYPPVLDDLPDRHIGLQDALEAPTGPPFGWDELYFMAYRTLYATLFKRDPGSGLVSSYYRSAQDWFGRSGQITLGIGGRAPYEQLDELVKDVRVLATLGARTVPIFSLETTVDRFGTGAVRALHDASRRPFQGAEAAAATAPSPEALADRGALTGLDASLTAGTPLSTADTPEGPQLANRYPDGCGDARAEPLRRAPARAPRSPRR